MHTTQIHQKLNKQTSEHEQPKETPWQIQIQHRVSSTKEEK